MTDFILSCYCSFVRVLCSVTQGYLGHQMPLGFVLEQRFPTWGTCTPGGAFAYPKGYM